MQVWIYRSTWQSQDKEIISRKQFRDFCYRCPNGFGDHVGAALLLNTLLFGLIPIYCFAKLIELQLMDIGGLGFVEQNRLVVDNHPELPHYQHTLTAWDMSSL